MAQGWTPGPWIFEPHNLFGTTDPKWLALNNGPPPFGYISTDLPRSPIFEMMPIFASPPAELEANARLIASAPALYEALEAVLRLHEAHHNHPTHAAARAALSAARGDA